ncbi:MAG: hypothetical protein EAZ61_06710 [Oscillatoriales cyanobacterium]|nr:MAG: hypothetical protein EAZ61_06710 [Oscillatoriales cyanobacterium]
MVRSDIFSQAQGGDPKAIAALMNHSLQRKHVTVRAALRAGCLTILATSRECPDARFMANFVRRGLDRLQPQQIHRVVIRGYAIGTIGSLWTAEFDPHSDAPPQISTLPQSNRPQTGQPRTGQPRTSQPTKLPRSARSQPPIGSSAQPRSIAPVTRRSSGSSASPRQSARSSKPKSRFSPVLEPLLNILALLAFFLLSILTILLAFGCKVWTAEFAETTIYQIQFLGDLLRGLEAAEIFNIIVFAILGLGLGLVTAFVPRSFGIRTTAAIGLIVLPVIFSISSMIRYQSWIREFSQSEKLDHDQAIAQTDIYLDRKVNQAGFWGFYLHTAKYPGLPTTQIQMEQIDTLESQAADRLEDAFSALLGSLPIKLELPQIFAICMWGIRLFYFLLSLLTAIGNFLQGIRWADYVARRHDTVDARS